MLETHGLGPIQRVRWADLGSGMIYVGGIHINDIIPPELREYPVLTPGLLDRLTETYRLRPDRQVLVIPVMPGFDPRRAAEGLRFAAEGLGRLNELRAQYAVERRRGFESLGLDPDADLRVIDSPGVERERLIRDVYNSFTVLVRDPPPQIPSFLGRIGLKLTVADLLSGRLREKIRLPADREVLLHLVVDYSFSMSSGGKHDLVVSALNLFYKYVSEFLLKTRINLYVFSDECRLVDYPLGGREIRRGETAYASFMKKVLHHKDPSVHNSVIVFTDGRSQDQPEALRLAALVRRNRVDYTQIVFRLSEDLRHEVDGDLRPGELRDGFVEDRAGLRRRELTDQEVEIRRTGIRQAFTEIAETAGGNQILLSIDELAGIVSVECYDRYLGLLTLATPRETAEVEASRVRGEQVREDAKGAQPGPRIRAPDFRRLPRRVE